MSIGGHRWHTVAFDEAHEMCINRDLKAAVVRPTKAYLQKTTLFFNNYRIKAYKKLISQMFPKRFSQCTNSRTILDSTSQAYHQEENIQQMCSAISMNCLLPPQLHTNWGVLNAFSSEQTTDMLDFHQIGTQAFQQYVTHRILRQPSSVNAPVRRWKLLKMPG